MPRTGGMPVLGICNGFQMLTEAHLLEGGLIRNDHGSFICRDQVLRVENTSTDWTSGFDAGQEITIPLKNGEGGFIADDETLDRLEGEGRVVFRYVDVNPNGSLRDIAGISNARGNVVGLMPHPSTRSSPASAPTPPRPCARASTASASSRASCSAHSSRRSRGCAPPILGLDSEGIHRLLRVVA